MKVAYSVDECDLSNLVGQTVGVVGYGIQGRAQALNLRDSGINVFISNRDDNYRTNAQDDGFDVVLTRRKSRKGETIIKKIITKVGYIFIEKITDIKIPKDTGDFRIVSKKSKQMR